MVDAPFLRLATQSPDDTRAVAAAVASVFRPGDVIALSGDLGAGKTCFVQGAAAALGVEVPVTSPTFVLVKYYPEAAIPIVHTDVYRLDRLRDMDDLGDEVMDPDSLTFIEWGDAIASILPQARLDVEILLTVDESGESTGREVILRDGGEGWADRWTTLHTAVSTWLPS